MTAEPHVATTDGASLASGGPRDARLSVSASSSINKSFEEDLELWGELGIDHVGLITQKVGPVAWDGRRQAVRAAGLRVSSVSTDRTGLTNALELATGLDHPVLCFTTGRAQAFPWEAAAERFCDEIASIADQARRHDVRLAVEPTNPLCSDVSFVHTVRDAIALADMADLAIVVDLYSCWYERDIAQLLHDKIDRVALVQVCDYQLGTFNMPNRCPIGDGDIPVETLLATIDDAGYEGAFEIEVLGPVIEDEGYRATISRSLDRTSAMLQRIAERER